ncbi:hypothetical protein GGR54DRAFT_615479 [Hypoxylon sp. NC1633]|nr:hypothetical protein GGR54DRAFT_615479 [Hypoxylon sp. NC1633]
MPSYLDVIPRVGQVPTTIFGFLPVFCCRFHVLAGYLRFSVETESGFLLLVPRVGWVLSSRPDNFRFPKFWIFSQRSLLNYRYQTCSPTDMASNIHPSSSDPGFSGKLSALVETPPVQTILEKWELNFAKWIELTRMTTLPTNTPTNSPLVKNAFQAIGQAIASGGLFARLANILLLRFLDSLESLIRSERKGGVNYGRMRNSTIAITKMNDFDQNLTRRQIMELKRTAKRWRYLASSSVFILLVYSEATESIVKNFSRTSDELLKKLSEQVANNIHENVHFVCHCLEEAAGEMVSFNTSYDVRIMGNEIRRVLVGMGDT